MPENLNHADYSPSHKTSEVQNNIETWASGNTKTITDTHVRANSFIQIMWIGEHPGSHYVTCSNGSFVITNTEALTNVQFKYRVH